MPPDIVLRVIDQLRELGRTILNARRKRDNSAPTRGRERLLVETLMELGQADQSQQIPLVDGENLFERPALRLGITQLPVRPGKVHPQWGSLRIALAGDLEVLCCRPGVFLLQCVEAKRIARGRLLAVYSEHSREMLPRPVRLTGLTRPMRLDEVLLNILGHAAELRPAGAPGQAGRSPARDG